MDNGSFPVGLKLLCNGRTDLLNKKPPYKSVAFNNEHLFMTSECKPIRFCSCLTGLNLLFVELLEAAL